MNITFAPRGILQIDDARIIYRNFAGRGDKYNREGDRNFAVIIPDVDILDSDNEFKPLVDVLTSNGWNVKIKPPREDGDTPFMYLPVKVKFNDRGPNAYLVSGRRMNRLDEDSIRCLDDVDISSVNLDIRPYNWTINGKEGRTAYLQSIKVYQRIDDRFAKEYDEQEGY